MLNGLLGDEQLSERASLAVWQYWCDGTELTDRRGHWAGSGDEELETRVPLLGNGHGTVHVHDTDRNCYRKRPVIICVGSSGFYAAASGTTSSSCYRSSSRKGWLEVIELKRDWGEASRKRHWHVDNRLGVDEVEEIEQFNRSERKTREAFNRSTYTEVVNLQCT